MKPKSPVQKNNLVVFSCEYPNGLPNRYAWYICIAMMIYTSLQEYIYISADLTKIYSANLTRHHFDTHTHAHTQLLKSIGVLDSAVLKTGKYKAYFKHLTCMYM